MKENPPKLSAVGSQPEPWLRGTFTEIPAEQRAVLHALELAREDIARWCGRLSDEEFHAHPYGLPSVATQMRHIAGSLARLLTYAEGNLLNEQQMRELAAEATPEGSKHELLAEFERGLDAAAARVRSIPLSEWREPRGVGRKKLPTTVAGLLIHCADHTQRHVGQAITTTKILLALRGNSLA
ncbi:MAG: DinB family protein [Acidobacteriaceae bacterium]